jgi:hypothetical protein
MTTFRFSAKVSREGTIKIPNGTELSDKEVEVYLVQKENNSSSMKKDGKGVKFVKKWAGFLKDVHHDEAKHNYLMEKYK